MKGKRRKGKDKGKVNVKSVKRRLKGKKECVRGKYVRTMGGVTNRFREGRGVFFWREIYRPLVLGHFPKKGTLAC